MLTLAACQSTDRQVQTDGITITQEQRSPASIIAQADKDDWRLVAADNMLKITLPTGPVYVELNPLLAPGHVDNIKALAREGFYQGLNMYRFVEGFVAQGGDQDGKREPVNGKKSIAAEFFHTSDEALTITELGLNDGYAPAQAF
ncbi:peptidylprolyl isomerase [Pseudoalteromonas sp. R3]|uniref:peptidylprolyl isomerase n=1 Tax=Pseudoalteromonas sp. R3 TaxID=1709477 RepID=UPI001F4E1AAC|nr:peptidylprolyl isomerase [Pseudoalteromonas sp. R3]